MEKTDDTHRHMDSVYGEDRYKLELTDYKLAVNPGDTIIFQIHTKDNIGFNYKVNVDGWSILDSKKFESISHDFSMGDYRFMEVIVE